MPGGSFIGALASGYLTDMFGRKTSIQVGCIIWCIGSIIVCASQNIGMLIVGRFINGLAVGICSAQVPVYVSELAPPSKRGRVVGAQQWYVKCHLHAVPKLPSYLFLSPKKNYTDFTVCLKGDHLGYSDHVLHLVRLHLP